LQNAEGGPKRLKKRQERNIEDTSGDVHHRSKPAGPFDVSTETDREIWTADMT
jgi:hypothetical protein